MSAEKLKKSFKDTLNLPTTDFPIRPKNQDREPELIKFWQDQNIYKTCYQDLNKNEQFVLHDGPPYTNGNIHTGHALNKILKDLVAKTHLKMGKKVHFQPGWDCHGLPIELKVAKQLGVDRNQAQQDSVAFKKACRKYSQEWIEIQKEEFQKLGVIADFENYYATMQFDYEANILRAFSKFVGQNFINRRNKTVPWCASCQTVLATAEIEYQDRKDPSVYLFFKFATEFEEQLKKQIVDDQDLELGFLVWTTTPWTLPLNRALMLHPEASYRLIKGSENKAFVVGAQLSEKLSEKFGIEHQVLGEFKSREFESFQVCHPVESGREVPIVFSHEVGLDNGTAIVHCAPGCGPEDYLIGIKNNLEVFSPISSAGCYTDEVNIPSLAEMSVADGQWWVLKFLNEQGTLIFKENIKHSYPHCWRCHNGLIFRATKQWFCDLGKNDLSKKVLEASKDLEFYPEWGRARLESFVGNRTEWCISRQRIWGVPITALKCQDCDQTYIDEKLVNVVADFVEKEGIEFWDTVSIETLKKEQAIDHDLKCSSCFGTAWKKEEDILDVWFDSGVSNFAVLKKGNVFPADLYLEGSDQHRGWFQTSSLSSMVIFGKLPTKAILTHGFLIDKDKLKMSKSKGNVTSPSEIIEKYGVDVLRLWAASADYSRDIAVSDKIFKSLAEVFRKIRNTCRFLISNLYDFESKPLEKLEVTELLMIDRYVLFKLKTLNTEVLQAYAEYNFTVAMQKVNNFCTNDLSSGYLDMVKDRLYVEQKDGKLRRSTQRTCGIILDVLIQLVSPVLSFLAEDLFSRRNEDGKSIFQSKFIEQNSLPELNLAENTAFALLEKAKTSLLKLIEVEREAGKIKHSLEAKLQIFINSDSEEGQAVAVFLKKIDENEGSLRFLKDWFIVSQIELCHDSVGFNQTDLVWLQALVQVATGQKCPRCWQWEESSNPDDLCNRCLLIVRL